MTQRSSKLLSVFHEVHERIHHINIPAGSREGIRLLLVDQVKPEGMVVTGLRRLSNGIRYWFQLVVQRRRLNQNIGTAHSYIAWSAECRRGRRCWNGTRHTGCGTGRLVLLGVLSTRGLLAGGSRCSRAVRRDRSSRRSCWYRRCE